MSKTHVSTFVELKDYLQKDSVILFKHSATCPVSADAYEQFTEFADSNPDFPSVYLVVQEDRELSTEVAETFHVKHESPQAILFRNGNVAWHASHWNITRASIEKALEE